MTIAESLKHAAKQLSESGVPEHVREGSSLLQFALERDRVFLVAHPEYELTADEQARFISILERRIGREPLQYITGRQEFCGLKFLVTPNVLIPRPETEMLVERSIELLRSAHAPLFADIGIGSGCIAISVLYSLSQVRAHGFDVSTRALEVASLNAGLHCVSERLSLFESDIYSAVDRHDYALIVSNPPYVPVDEIDGLQPEVKNFEPRSALTDGGDGLSVIRDLIKHAPDFLRPGGSLVLEIGFGQATAVSGMFDPKLWRNVEFVPDSQQIPRMATAQIA